MKKQNLKLMLDSESNILPMANQIAQTTDKTNIILLKKYTEHQLVLAEENSFTVGSGSTTDGVVLKYSFSDEENVPELHFLLKGTINIIQNVSK